MITLHVLSVALNIYVLAVISCGTDRQLQSAMVINTVHQVHKNLIAVCIRGGQLSIHDNVVNVPADVN